MRLKFVAKAHVKSADDEKQDYGCGKQDVVHKFVRRLQLDAAGETSHFLRFSGLTLRRLLALPGLPPGDIERGGDEAGPHDRADQKQIVHAPI
jgi:hypothetical protein